LRRVGLGREKDDRREKSRQTFLLGRGGRVADARRGGRGEGGRPGRAKRKMARKRMKDWKKLRREIIRANLL